MLRIQQGIELLLERGIIVISLEITVNRKRDNSRFLGYNYHHSVTYLGKPYGCSVASAEILVYIGLGRERQKTACRVYPSVPHDNCSVMKRCFVEKYISEHIRGYHRINDNSRFYILSKLSASLNNDKRANLVTRKIARRVAYSLYLSVKRRKLSRL